MTRYTNLTKLCIKLSRSSKIRPTVGSDYTDFDVFEAIYGCGLKVDELSQWMSFMSM